MPKFSIELERFSQNTRAHSYLYHSTSLHTYSKTHREIIKANHTPDRLVFWGHHPARECVRSGAEGVKHMNTNTLYNYVMYICLYIYIYMRCLERKLQQAPFWPN